MSEKTAELWTRADDSDEAPASIEAALQERNQSLNWDHENLASGSSNEQEPVSADN